MNWDEVVAAFLAELAAANEIIAFCGGGRRVRMSGATDFTTPLCEVTVIADSLSELWAPVVVQVDLFHKSLAAITTAEKYLVRRYHSQLPIPIGGLNCWAQYSDGAVLDTPDRDGINGRAIRFTFSPLRAAYTNPGS